MSGTSSINVLPFDPIHGADNCKLYAGKYASKPEKWYFMENVRGGVKDWLRARTVGLCMAFNKILGFQVVKSTRPVLYTPCEFLTPRAHRSRREESHQQRCPGYPDPDFYLNATQEYFFRHPGLRHLRIEQYQRYLATSEHNGTMEDTVEDPDDVPIDTAHRHYDEQLESMSAGTHFPSSAAHVRGARRRKQSQLCVSRLPFIECLGSTREAYYEKQLLTTLPWYCADGPTKEEDQPTWHFHWKPLPP